MKADRKDFYRKLFENADEAERKLIGRTIDEVVDMEERMDQLKKLPFVRVNPSNPEQQKVLPAWKVYKELQSNHRESIRLMLNVLRKVETSAQDELLKRLEEFM